MIDVEFRFWRRFQKEGFEDQRKKVFQFVDWWKFYDWIQSQDNFFVGFVLYGVINFLIYFVSGILF